MSNFNNGAPCRASSDLRIYGRRQNNSTSYMLRVEKIAARLAEELIQDPEKLKALVYDFEIDVFSELARALQSLDQACKGEQLAITTCLNALHKIEKSVLRVALDEVTEKAERLADLE